MSVGLSGTPPSRSRGSCRNPQQRIHESHCREVQFADRCKNDGGVKAGLVDDEEDYIEKATELFPSAEFEGKVDRLNHVLRYFSKDTRVLGVGATLLSSA